MSALLARRYYRRGERELQSGDLDAAADSFRAASELLPSFISARIGQAVVVARQGDTPRAAQLLRAGIARRPRSAGTRSALWKTLGDVLTKGGDYLGALDAYAEARSAVAAPSDSRTVDDAVEATLYDSEARVLAKLGRYGESIERLMASVRAAKAARGE
jgi:tetratricopeptide (TPR) repeat protein